MGPLKFARSTCSAWTARVDYASCIPNNLTRSLFIYSGENKTPCREIKTARYPPQKRARERFSFDKKVDVIGPGAESSAAHVLVTAVVCLTEIWATVVCESAALAHTHAHAHAVHTAPAYKQRYYGNTVHTYHFTHTFCYFLSAGDGLLIALSWKPSAAEECVLKQFLPEHN